MSRLFVYGTLKRGFANHKELAGQVFVGEAQTAPGFRLFDVGGYPGMVAWPGDAAGVTGEVWSVTAAGLARLDRFEGVDKGLYIRSNVPLLAPFAEEKIDAYLFPGNTEGKREVGSTWREPKP